MRVIAESVPNAGRAQEVLEPLPIGPSGIGLRPAPRSAWRILLGRPARAGQLREEVAEMSVARVTEISARSDRSFEAAMQEGVDRANKTLRNVKSAWIKEQQVDVEDGRIIGYRVNMLVTFVLDD
jgi:flavin-binding protein dodecin